MRKNPIGPMRARIGGKRVAGRTSFVSVVLLACLVLASCAPAPLVSPQPEASQQAAASRQPGYAPAGVRETFRAQQEQLARQERKLTELSRILAEQQRLLSAQREDTKILQRHFRQGLSPAVTPALYRGPGQGRRAGPFLAQAPAPRAPVPLPPEGQPPAPVKPETPGTPGEAERPKAEKPTELLLLERGAVLLPKGVLQVEPSVDYTHISSDRVAISGFTIFEAILIGVIRVDDLDRDIVTNSISLRYGVTNRIQVGGRVPFVWRQDTEVLGVGTSDVTERTIDGFSIGDIEASASWQALLGRGWIPGTILRLRTRFPTGTHPFEIERITIADNPGRTFLAEAPTGSGFTGIAPGVTFVWRADPAVFFAGTSFTFNLERSFDDFGTIDPGDTFEWFGGMNVAMSEQVSLNLSFVSQITGSTVQNGIEAPGTSANSSSLILGTSVGLLPRMSLLVSAAVGLTDESPDFQFTVSLPMSFALF